MAQENRNMCVASKMCKEYSIAFGFRILALGKEQRAGVW